MDSRYIGRIWYIIVMADRRKLLSNRCLRIAVAITLLFALSTCILLVCADFLGLPFELAVPGCCWLVSALRPSSSAAAETRSRDSPPPLLVDLRGTVSGVSREHAALWPASHKPSAVADALWHDYLMLYRFLGNGSVSAGRHLSGTTAEGHRESRTGCHNHSLYIAGSVHLATYAVRLAELDALEFFVEPGGHHQPPMRGGCAARANVAIIIPFRNRWEHLASWLLHMHPFLQRQQLSYTVYVVNQEPRGKFNRGMLLNIGFKEASLAEKPYDCYIFHDVDLLPENDNNIYDCSDAPRHMSSAVDKFNYRLPYQWLLGGVVALTKEQFEEVNGYSNLFFGWGGEDDDFSERLLTKGYQVTRYKPSIARYRMLRHDLDAGNEVNPQRYRLLQRSHDRLEFDGLSSLQYAATDRKLCRLFTWISVDINQADVFRLHQGVM